MPDLVTWLAEIGLGRYADAFRANEISFEQLATLSEADLRELGIPIGPRKRLLAALAALPPAPSARASDAATTTGERRPLTLLFADIVDSTAMATRLDPEEWRDLLLTYQRAIAAAVERHGGHVGQFVGDGVVAYFGWPAAHDDDSDRAVEAGLDLHAAIARLNAEAEAQGRPKLEARAGIHAGTVVIGTDGDVYGEATNIAARVQGAAEPGTVYITERVRQACRSALALEDRGSPALKGVTPPIRLYRVLAPPSERRRLGARAQGHLTPFIGRAAELDRLIESWRKARAGEGQCVAITGEPGIGKSRLVHEFRARIAGEPHIWFEGGGARHAEQTPFHALAQLAGKALGLHASDSAETRLERLQRALTSAGIDAEAALPAVAEMLGLALPPQRFVPPLFAPEQQRRRLLSTLATWISRIARRRPTVIAIEDMQWVDPSTGELIQLLIDQVASVPLLLLLTRRAEGQSAARPAGSVTELALARLPPEAVREMVRRLAGGRSLPAEMVEALVERAGGVPLFAEELAHAVLLDQGARPAEEIPATLAASLTGRLDRLGAAKAIAQLAAVIGSNPSFELIRAVADLPETELAPLLGQLTESEILIAHGTPPEVAYTFRHALVQDAAYEGLLRSQRKRLHRRTATIITERFAELGRAAPAMLARHWALGGEPDRAVTVWQEAAAAAAARRAFKEAEYAYQAALNSLGKLPPAPERDARELKLLHGLIVVQHITRGYSAAETAAAMERARALAHQVGNVSQLLLQIAGSWAAQSSAGDYEAAAGSARQFMELARGAGDADALANAHMIEMTSLYRQGELTAAERVFRAGTSYFTNEQYRRRPGAVAQTYGNAARLAWLLGDFAAARGRMAEALATAEALGNPYDKAFAAYMAAILAVLLRQPAEARGQAEVALALSDQHGFPQFAALSRIALGRAGIDGDDRRDAVALIQDGLAGMIRTRSRVALTLYLTWLAEAQAATGAAADALATIERAAEINPRERFFRPEILRVRGAIEARAGRLSQAEADFRAAIEDARAMQAATLELRALLALSHLPRRRGEASAEIASLLTRLDDGSDLDDLRDARAIRATPAGLPERGCGG